MRTIRRGCSARRLPLFEEGSGRRAPPIRSMQGGGGGKPPLWPISCPRPQPLIPRFASRVSPPPTRLRSVAAFAPIPHRMWRRKRIRAPRGVNAVPFDAVGARQAGFDAAPSFGYEHPAGTRCTVFGDDEQSGRQGRGKDALIERSAVSAVPVQNLASVALAAPNCRPCSYRLCRRQGGRSPIRLTSLRGFGCAGPARRTHGPESMIPLSEAARSLGNKADVRLREAT